MRAISRGARAAGLLGLLVAGFPGGLRAQEPTPEPAPTSTPVPQPTPTRKPGFTPAALGAGTSLADIVRKSQAEKEKQPKKKSIGVITNEQVKKPTPAADGSKTAPSTKVMPTPTPVPLGRFEARDAKGRTEADWKTLVAEARLRIARAEARVKALDAEGRRLENDFYAWGDGNYRDRVIKPAWDQAREELKKARQEVEDARQAFADLEEDARKSDAPPGWLRE